MSTSTGCNLWLSLTKPTLKVALLANKNRSVVPRTNKCGWATRQLELVPLNIIFSIIFNVVRESSLGGSNIASCVAHPRSSIGGPSRTRTSERPRRLNGAGNSHQFPAKSILVVRFCWGLPRCESRAPGMVASKGRRSRTAPSVFADKFML